MREILGVMKRNEPKKHKADGKVEKKKKKQHKPNEENILVKRALTLMVQICQIR